MRKSILSGFVTVVMMSSLALATPIITINPLALLPNTPNQTITISISGGDALAGMNLYAQVGDGGPELSQFPGLSAGTDGPSITGVNFQPTGGIFTGTGTQGALLGIPQVAICSFDVSSGTVSANGVLVQLTIDTTGFTTGKWDLRLTNVLPFAGYGPDATTGVANDAYGTSIACNITNGSITMAIPGDTDASGTVNPTDLTTLLSHWDPTGTTHTWTDGSFFPADNGSVGPADLTALLTNWAPTGYLTQTDTVMTVPEPATLSLLALGTLAFLRRNKRS